MDVKSFIAAIPALLMNNALPAGDENDQQVAFRQVINNIGGMTTPTIMSLLNAGVKYLAPGEIYCEVGCYHGCTLIGALLGNDARAVAVDNFSEFCDNPGIAKRLLLSNLDQYHLSSQVSFYDQDFHNFFKGATPEIVPSIGVYFYDGNHSEEAGLAGLEMALPFLADDALIFVDDIMMGDVTRSMNRMVGAHPHNLTPVFLANVVKEGDPLFWFGIGVWRFHRDLQ
jgi:protein O-GlcNAc transferase